MQKTQNTYSNLVKEKQSLSDSFHIKQAGLKIAR